MRATRKTRLAVTRIMLCAFVLSTTTAYATPEAYAAPTAVFPTVMTHNLMLLPSGITDWEPDLRARRAGEAKYLQVPDVVILTELFDNTASDDALFPRLAAGHPYRTQVVGRTTSGWDSTTGGYIGFPFEDGGVAIVSRWPITYRAQYVYPDGCGTDWWSSKGFAYVLLNLGGTRVHVIGTHLQADDAGCEPGEAAEVRTNQIRAIDTYLTARAIPFNEPVVIGGDLNIGHNTIEFVRMLSLLHASPPLFAPGTIASYDPSANGIAAYRDPEGLPAKMDYVLLRAGHPSPIYAGLVGFKECTARRM